MENIELNVLATMLSKSVWDRVKNFITPSMFPKDWRTIAHTIRKAHLDYEDIDKLDKPSLVAVHKILYPATPDSKAEQVDVLIDNLLSIQTVNEELAYDWAKVFWQRDIARQIGEKAVEFWTGDNELAFSDIAKMMDRVSSNSLEPHDTFVIIRDDFQELVQATTETPDFTFGTYVVNGNELTYSEKRMRGSWEFSIDKIGDKELLVLHNVEGKNIAYYLKVREIMYGK